MSRHNILIEEKCRAYDRVEHILQNDRNRINLIFSKKNCQATDRADRKMFQNGESGLRGRKIGCAG
jgi:hypothetical protein